MKLKYIANPFAAFSISWLFCIYIYSLGWAKIYPDLNTSLLLFVIGSIVLFAFVGFVYNKIQISSNIKNIKNYHNKSLLMINTLLWLGNFLYSGVPILKGLRDDDFGIPTIIVLSTSLTSFLSLYFFYQYLINKNRKLLLCSVYCLMFFIIEISRGYIVMSIINMFFLWIILKKPIVNLKTVMIIVITALTMMYVFGVAGNLRAAKDIASWNPNFDESYSSTPILEIGQESESFKANIVPDEYFWTYLYVSSPLSNLQYNINNIHSSITFKGITSIIYNELLWDAVSKRINKFIGKTRVVPLMVVPQLTVCTTLVGSYLYAGWSGMFFFISIILFIPFIHNLITFNNPLNILGVSILCTMYFFSIFDNMLILSGLSFQLVLPSVIYFYSKINFNK